MLNPSSPITQPSSSASEGTPFLTKEWLEPRLVVATLVLIAMSFVAENQQWAPRLILLINIASYLTGDGLVCGAIHALVEERVVDVDLLMILAALGAAVIGEWHEGAILSSCFTQQRVTRLRHRAQS
ncbi:MAG UNVERIFIED_CONTAM: hypothetical protein LVT10_09850 [Anaerolineae bacterium]|jgi:Cd2+/Zn2+-exporting ATPase